MLGITIRINAATDSVSVGGKVFDRSKLAREQKAALRRAVVRAFRQKAGR